MLQRFGTTGQTELALAILRVVTGIVFAAHGYQKFFLMGIDGTTAFFAGAGVPFPGLTAAMVATLELVGGIALVLGIFTRLVAIPLALDILGAIVFVHAKNGFWVPRGVEFVMMLLVAAITLALAGPGSPSVDRMLGGGHRSRG